jgi:lysophospholipase L1-like esterase
MPDNPTINDLITDIEASKENIKSSVQSKGVDVPEGAKLNELSAYVDAINAGTIDGAVRYDIVQNLTDEQKQIAWNNLGIQPGGSNEPVTTEVEFTYDGDNTSDAHEWIVNYSNIRIFVRVGDVPEGTINLLGGVVTALTPNNQWLNYSVEITEDKLDEIIIKYDTEIYAKQVGLIQFFHQAANDFTPQTIFLICTKPGWYNLAFDDWFETINIEKTGVYFFDKRNYGGSTYVNSLTFTVTTEGSGSGGGGIIIPDLVIPTTYGGTEMSMFSRGICIGDSVTEGSFDSNEGGAVIKKFSYPRILQRLSGVEIVNAGIAGATSKTWYEASLNSDPQWGKWLNYEWVWNTNPPAGANDVVSSSLDLSGFDFAVIHLGINDLGLAGTSSIDDILTNYETYINKIITALTTANKDIRIFLATIIPTYATPTNTNYKLLNEKIKTITTYSNHTYLLDLNTYSDCEIEGEYNVIHPTALGYHKIATEIYSYIGYIVHENLNEFRTVQFIGTDHTI